ncbi:hypothetical protein [Methanobacterium alcaliphilum]|uniref:hypothetical protein n=1 Tax=Methanobacterium alcaliphilum TaxID=392018 RepID=UPI00200B7911|nr:hypothetical protein [Methanobacterium alcaliphilum]MCK9152095.1 hypothetical protein [Methanobacterium alcaliphilum]
MIAYSNIVAGILILLIGFIFHFVGQFISLINWEKAVKLGIAEKNILPEYRDYEYGIAMADLCIGWLYLIIGFGLILDQSWSFKLAWIPGVIFIYHSISFYFWSTKQEKRGYKYRSTSGKISWFLLNLVGGIVILLFAWAG